MGLSARLCVVVAALFAGLVSFGIHNTAEDAGYKPRLPSLEIKLKDGDTKVYRGGQKEALEVAELETELQNLGTHLDEDRGWKGRDENGISENPLVMHVDALASVGEVEGVVENAAKQKLYRMVVGITGRVEDALSGETAPDLDKLDAEYLHIDLPKDEGLSSVPTVPKEVVTLYARWDKQAEAASFIVALSARGRKPVERSHISKADLVAKNSEQRDSVRDNAKKAVATYIAKAGGAIEIIELAVVTIEEETNDAPWVLLDLAYRVARELNKDRKKKDLAELEILLPYQHDSAEPPPPAFPPEGEVEFPKDEPHKEDPTEDERIAPDSEDEANEDPNGKPNKGSSEKDNAEWPGRADPDEAKGFSFRRKRGLRRPHEDRVLAALNWLKDHQHKDGYWSATTFSDDSKRKGAVKTHNIEIAKIGDAKGDQGWEGITDVGLSGLAVLAFAGFGFDHEAGEYSDAVRKALPYFKKIQTNDGCFGSQEEDLFVYNHSIVTMALAEICGLSGDQELKPIVEKAGEFIVNAQNPGLGWRYGIKPGDNDTSITTWMVMALKSCKMAGFECEYDKVFGDAAKWFQKMTVGVEGVPKTGYDVPGSNNPRLRSHQDYVHNPTMDAMYVWAMPAMGHATYTDETVKSLARVLTEKTNLPTWERLKIDFYYWYHGTNACYQAGGSVWETWERPLLTALLDHQRGYSDADKKADRVTNNALGEHGSWDPVGAWGSAGGRVYSTAMGALTLEVYYRYERIADEE